MAAATGRRADPRPGRSAPRARARRRVPDRARRLRAGRDQAPAGRRRRASRPPERGDAEHARTALSQRRVRRRPRLPGRHRSSAASSRAPSGSTCFQDTFLVGMSPQHRLAASNGPVSLAEFADDDWIVPSIDGFLAQACRDAGFEPRVVSTTQDPLATRGLIARGIGVGWVPTLLIDDYAGVATRPLDQPHAAARHLRAAAARRTPPARQDRRRRPVGHRRAGYR